MSWGYTGLCRKALEDDEMVLYTYAGENWNDNGSSKSGDSLLQDGLIVIYKRCLEEPELHTRNRRMPGGKKVPITKRITHVPSIEKHVASRDIIVEKECKNAFRRPAHAPIDHIAYQLLVHTFERYQKDGILPEEESFLQ